MKWKTYRILITIFFPLQILWVFKLFTRLIYHFTSIDPENLKIDFPGGYIETAIPASEIPGVDASSLELPEIPPIEPVTIPVVDTTGALPYLEPV